MNGLCFNCEKGSPGCKNCIITETQSDNGQKDYNYECKGCISTEYRLVNFGTCEKCKISHCHKCKFSDDNQECIQYEANFYLSNDGTCKSCSQSLINYGYYINSSDNNSNLSSCYCSYSNYAINENKIYSPCVEGCNYCYINENNISECLRYKSGKFKNENECLICPRGCSTCIFGDKGQIILHHVNLNIYYLMELSNFVIEAVIIVLFKMIIIFLVYHANIIMLIVLIIKFAHIAEI